MGFGSSKLSEWIQKWGINAVRIGDHPFKFTIPLRITGYLPIMETINSQFLLFGGGETLLNCSIRAEATRNSAFMGEINGLLTA